jgi:hypothetical protein
MCSEKEQFPRAFLGPIEYVTVLDGQGEVDAINEQGTVVSA